MSEKTHCPGCDAYLSSIRDAFDRMEPCPNCGLSAGAASEIEAVRRKAASKALRQRHEAVLIQRDQALARVAVLNHALEEIRGHMEEINEQLKCLKDPEGTLIELLKEWRGAWY